MFNFETTNYNLNQKYTTLGFCEPKKWVNSLKLLTLEVYQKVTQLLPRVCVLGQNTKVKAPAPEKV